MREGLCPTSAQAHRRIARAFERSERNLRGERFPSFRHSERSRGIPGYSRGHFHGIVRLRCASLRMIMLDVIRLSLCAFRVDLDIDRDCLADSGH